MKPQFDMVVATFGEWLDELSLMDHDESPHLKDILADLYNEGPARFYKSSTSKDLGRPLFLHKCHLAP